MNTGQLTTTQGVGLTTLQHLSEAKRLNQWMFETIRPYVKGEVLEIGSGIGNISSFFVEAGIPITLSDLDLHYCSLLEKNFENENKVKGIYQLDLANSSFKSAYASLLGRFDTVFALNVVEHIPNDKLAIANAKLLLRRGGHLVVLVPAYTALYNGLDQGLEHWRRYNRHSLKKLLSKDFEILKTQYFNLAGIVGWFLSGSVLKKATLPSAQVSLYDKLVPLFRIADTMTFNQVGLSVIAVGRKSV